MSAAPAEQPYIHVRPEFEASDLAAADLGDIARPLSWFERIWNTNGVRKATILIGLVGLWQAYTVIGDVVNVASRLSEKAGGGQILITESLYEHGDIKRRVKARPHEPLEIRGKSERVQTYIVNQVTGKYKDAMDAGIEQLLAAKTEL